MANSPSSPNPVKGYHGLKFWDTFGSDSPFGNIAFIIKARVEGLRDLGPSQSPFNSFLHIQGLETLSLRMDTPCGEYAGTGTMAAETSQVDQVNYPGLESNPHHARWPANTFPGVQAEYFLSF
jgi:O-acetylhomoserine/O-acetylserine sulfhydrylase